VTHEGDLVVEVCGEGKTDVGEAADAVRPVKGVVPILVHTLCGRPRQMLVKSRRLMHLEGKTFQQKAWFAKRQASYNRSHAAVFVVDSEGTHKDLKRIGGELDDGRNRGLLEFPMAVGVAHPCIESWLLADAAAICRATGLATTPEVPDQPEELPAPCRDRRKNPKTELARIAGSSRAKNKYKIAAAMNDMDLVRTRCPLGFAPFADEVQQRIAPLF